MSRRVDYENRGTKEIKRQENRVGLTPQGVKVHTRLDHYIVIESNAGDGSGYSNVENEPSGDIFK